MMRRRPSSRIVAAFAVVLCLTTGCTGASDDSDGDDPTTTKGVDHHGPDLAGVTDATSLVAALEAYEGPYTIEADVDFAGEHTETTRFDGTSWSRVDDPGSPIEEFRWISDGKTATCFQHDEDNWVSGGSPTDLAERRLASNVDNWSVFQYIDGKAERPLEEVVRFENTPDGFALTVITPPADYLTRVEFVVADGTLTGTRQFMTDESLRSTQKISYRDVAAITAPKGAKDGIDVLC